MNRLMLSVVAVIAALSAPAAEAQVAPPPAAAARSADEQAIWELEGRWNRLIAARDLEGIVALYASDGLVMPAGSPAAQGPAAVRQVWTGLLGLPGLKATLTPLQVTVAGSRDLALDRGRYELTTTGAGGPATEVGKYLVVWKKVGGAWKVAADMFSSDAPAPK